MTVVAGCGETEGGDGDSGGFCERWIVKLTDCGMSAFVPEEKDECSEPTEEDQCAAGCVMRASCDDLMLLFCWEEAKIKSALDQCFEGCRPPPFRCGSGENVDDEYHCNGSDDCSDGSDESGCPTFRCANGELVPEYYECNFYPECSDGSDEHSGCLGGFECGSGQIIPEDWECDGFDDCADYSDEPSSCPPSPEEQLCGTM